MNIKIHIVFVFLIIFITVIKAALTTFGRKTILQDIEQNEGECPMYTNPIESYINEYKQNFNSLSVECQLHVKSTTDKLKSTVDSMIVKKLEEHLAHVEAMKSKLIEIQKNAFLHDEKNKNELNKTRFVNDTIDSWSSVLLSLSPTVVIRNVKLNKNINAHKHNYLNYDNLRRNPVGFSSNTEDPHEALNLISVLHGSYYFYIQSRHSKDYIYAETDDFALDSERRKVFVWIPSDVKETGKWQLEAIQGTPYFKIKNVYWNEYLALVEGFNVETHTRIVTLRSGKCEDDYCKWSIIKYTGV